MHYIATVRVHLKIYVCVYVYILFYHCCLYACTVGQSDPDILLSSLIIAHDQHEQVKETDLREEVGKEYIMYPILHMHIMYTILHMYICTQYYTCTYVHNTTHAHNVHMYKREGERDVEIKQLELHSIILSHSY